MQRTSYLEGRDTLDALCQHFNVRPTQHPGGPIEPTFDMPVIRDARMPTHVLAVVQPDYLPSAAPIMFPIDADRFSAGFRVELTLPPTAPGTPAPIPRTVGSDNNSLIVTLPVVQIAIPHINSLGLLLLYGMGLETNTHALAWRLLPVNVVEEFPNAAAMASVLSRNRDDVFDNMFRHNHGIWKNILALGLVDGVVLQYVQTAWNVTAEARRIRQRGGV